MQKEIELFDCTPNDQGTHIYVDFVSTEGEHTATVNKLPISTKILREYIIEEELNIVEDYNETMDDVVIRKVSPRDYLANNRDKVVKLFLEANLQEV